MMTAGPEKTVQVLAETLKTIATVLRLPDDCTREDLVDKVRTLVARPAASVADLNRALLEGSLLLAESGTPLVGVRPPRPAPVPSPASPASPHPTNYACWGGFMTGARVRVARVVDDGCPVLHTKWSRDALGVVGIVQVHDTVDGTCLLAQLDPPIQGSRTYWVPAAALDVLPFDHSA